MKRKASISDKTQVEESILSCGPDARFRLSNLNSFFSSVELQSEILDLCAQNPKSIGQEGTALTRCTARRTAISSESSTLQRSHHFGRERAVPPDDHRIANSRR
ncbi:hypothetical protein F2Q70_00027275 [Brassica cretica]|uniref:Uncharacterized protein n=1 Tax=Brassica cretica TaxID=69181 RepID=A0A8S9LAK2_BRACR|nr:hypothetical protein F2Q70_00027275 [Brassica cretica]